MNFSSAAISESGRKYDITAMMTARRQTKKTKMPNRYSRHKACPSPGMIRFRSKAGHELSVPFTFFASFWG